MKNIYHRDIVNILLRAGSDGMRLCNIVRNIYNCHADLFDSEVDYDSLYANIGLYLWREAGKKRSVFQHKSYGVYAIKPAIAVQLDFFVDIPLDKDDDMDIAPSADPKVVQLEFPF